VFLIVAPVLALTHLAEWIPPGLSSLLVFPMAVVPNLWGLWNLIYQRFVAGSRVSLGAFGSLLPLILIPCGLYLSSVMNLTFYTARDALVMLPVGMAIYYLAWKFVVGFFNRTVGLAP